jgi:predicted amino acid dehydrogenase
MAAATYKRTWTTLAIVGYTGSVAESYGKENKSAHGGVCLLQVRKVKNGLDGLMARRVNSNGSHQEVGKAFLIDDVTLARWHKIAKAAR